MAQRLSVDWKLAESLYIQGVSPSKIAKDLNIPQQTLNKRVTRKGWTKSRDNMSQVVGDELAERAKQWRLWAVDAADRFMQALRGLPKSRVDKLTRQDVQSALDVIGMGIKAYGLDRQPEGGGVRLGVYLNCTPTDPVANAKPAQVVDTEASGD